jgi:hypothetical protein
MATMLAFRFRRASLGACVLALAGLGPLAFAADPASPDDAFLDGLRGDWDMAGNVRGKPVRYHARGERVLQDGFLRLHMIDVQQPPKYEADVFLGFDAKAGDYVAHWLDRFGAAGARAVATGKRDGQRLVINYPYVEGVFRDIFDFDAKAGTWTLKIDSWSEDDKVWSSFASYTLARPGADQAPGR